MGQIFLKIFVIDIKWYQKRENKDEDGEGEKGEKSHVWDASLYWDGLNILPKQF
jgi:hypothetical protein